MIGLKNATKASMAWYVSYRTGGTTVMHIFKGKELAIDVACRFFDRGYHESLEVGPMLGSREGNGPGRHSTDPRDRDAPTNSRGEARSSSFILGRIGGLI